MYVIDRARQKMWANKVGQIVWLVHQNSLLCIQQMRHSMKMSHALTFRWQSGGMHCNQIHRQLIQQLLGDHWKKDPQLVPIALPSDIPLAPDDLLKLLICSCSSETPCKTQRCGCSSASIACSVFCACQDGQGCFNERTRQAFQTGDDGENE